MLGPLEILEQVYQRGCTTVRPLCERLALLPGGYSRGLQEAVVDFGAEDSFALAAERLGRHHPVTLCANTVRKITLSHAGAMKERQRAEGCLGALPAKGAEQLIAEADGTMLPVVDLGEASAKVPDQRKIRQVRWMEMRLCAVRCADEVRVHYGCEATAVEFLGYRWSHCAGEAGWGLNSRIHVVSDGAAWIARQQQACFGSQATHLLDLYHVMEYLAAAQKAHVPWQRPRRRWLHTQKRRLLKGQSAKVIVELAPHIEPKAAGDEAPIRAAWRYLSNHRHQLDYPRALAEKLPLGSGMIEGGHRHVLQKRLKISGAWWTSGNLEAMAQLRVCRANLQWDQYWENAA